MTDSQEQKQSSDEVSIQMLTSAYIKALHELGDAMCDGSNAALIIAQRMEGQQPTSAGWLNKLHHAMKRSIQAHRDLAEVTRQFQPFLETIPEIPKKDTKACPVTIPPN